jgi:hypothetical protein
MAEHAGVARGPISSSLHDGQVMSSNRPGQRNTTGTVIGVAIALATGGSAIATTTVLQTIDTWATNQSSVGSGGNWGLTYIYSDSTVFSSRYAQANGGGSLTGTTMSVNGSSQEVQILYGSGFLSTATAAPHPWLSLTINNLVNAGGATITVNLDNNPSWYATKTVSANGVMEFQRSDFAPGYNWSGGMGYLSLFIYGVGAGGSATTFDLSNFTYNIPAPGAIAMLGMVGLTSRRRRTA